MSRARPLRAACIAIAGLAVAGMSSPLRAEPSAQAPAITVEGERQAPQAARKAPEVSASIITRERLEQPAMTAPEALRIAPGVQIVALGGFGAVATASLRGATAAQTPVYFAGVRLNDEVSGVGNLSDVPLAFVDHVEIYRSHPPLEASDLGIGGAILFEPKLPKTQELRLSLFAGSLLFVASRAERLQVCARCPLPALCNRGDVVNLTGRRYALHLHASSAQRLKG